MTFLGPFFRSFALQHSRYSINELSSIILYFCTRQQLKCNTTTHFTLQLNTERSNFAFLHTTSDSEQGEFISVCLARTCLHCQLDSDWIASQLCKKFTPEAKRKIRFCFLRKMNTKIRFANWNWIIKFISKSSGNAHLPLLFPLSHMQMNSFRKQRLYRPRNHIESLALDSSQNMLLTLLLLLNRRLWNFHCKTLFHCTLP